MNKFLGIGAAVSLTLALAACTQESDKPKEEVKEEAPVVEKEKTPETTEVTPEKNEQKEETPITDTTKETKPDGAKSSVVNAEPAKSIEVSTPKGEKEPRKGSLQTSENGYNLYVLEGFALEQEEPGKDVLLNSQDGNAYVRIERLDSINNLNDVKNVALQAAKEVGDSHELPATEAFDPYFYDANFFVVASNDQEGTVMYLVKEVNDVPFKYTIHLPVKASETVSSSLYAMLKTVAPLTAE